MKRHNLFIFILLCCATLVSIYNEHITNVALFDIMSELQVDEVTAQWLVSAYMIMSANAVAVSAFLIKRFKTRNLFFTAALLFVVGSIGDFFAPNFALLLMFRIIQGFSTGLFIVMSVSSIYVLASPKKAPLFLAIAGMSFGFGSALASPVSGIMIDNLGWRFIFLVPCVAMLVCLFASMFVLKNLQKTQKVKIDVLSLACSVIGLVCITYGLTQMLTQTAICLACITGGIVILVLFCVRQNHLETPLLSMKPFTHSHFRCCVLLVVITFMANFAKIFLQPFYFRGVAELSATESGLLIFIPVIITSFISVLAGYIMSKHGEWPLIPLGFFIFALAECAIGIVAGYFPGKETVLSMFICILFAGIGYSLVYSPVQASGLAVLDKNIVPDGASLINVFAQIAACLGPSLFTGIMSASSEMYQQGNSLEHFGNFSTLDVQQAAQSYGISLAFIASALVIVIGAVIACVFAWKAHKKAKCI